MSPPQPPPIRVVIVEDHPLTRLGLVTALGQEPGIEVVGEAADAEAALRLVEQQRPEVILLDLRVPGADGMWLASHLHRRHPASTLIILTTFDDPATRAAARRAGAWAFLPKTAPPERVRATVLAARQPAGQPGPAPPAEVLEVLSLRLTERERLVLRLVAEGRSNLAIASQLGLSLASVKRALRAAADKLGAENRAQAAAEASRLGLL